MKNHHNGFSGFNSIRIPGTFTEQKFDETINMWAYFLNNYVKLAVIFLIALIVLKILLTVMFQKDYERTVVGIVFSIFKWYSVVNRDMVETSTERVVMGFQNFISVIFYTGATILLFAVLLIK